MIKKIKYYFDWARRQGLSLETLYEVLSNMVMNNSYAFDDPEKQRRWDEIKQKCKRTEKESNTETL